MLPIHQFSVITYVIVILNTAASFTFPLLSKPIGRFTPKRVRMNDTPVVTLLVEIPMSSVQYAKPLDVKTGGKFYLETPMEYYAYSSAGRSNLHRVNVKYLMQSMYRANLMCFFLHFWSMKDPMVPWNVPHARVSPPHWFSKRLPN